MNTKYFLAGSLVIFAGILIQGSAAAAPLCPNHESFFGTIERVRGSVLNVRTPSGHGAIVVVDRNARINANGSRVRRGEFLGAYGCVTPNGVFHADEVTLSNNQAQYDERLTGVVRRIESRGRLLVQQNGHGYGTWYVPDTAAYRVGQTLTASGMIGADGAFYPQSIDGNVTAYGADAVSPGQITLAGTVQRVRANELIVWEPARHTTGTWLVPNAARFRAGERVTATGTEDRFGRFYVQDITAM